MRITDFDIYRDLLKKHSGFSISQDKSYLLDSRLTPIAKKWGYHSIEGLTLALRGVPDSAMITDIVEAMTTNETSFFRDQKPFDLFTDTVLPYLNDKRKKSATLKIWCAGCSTGQEPYSLALLIKENPHLIKGRHVEILATDIADKVLDKAREGVFSQFDVQRGMPVQMLLKHFKQDGDSWKLNEDIRKIVSFEKFNLLDDMGDKSVFDIIFCRNVLVYFDEDTKRDILTRLSEHIASDGFLYLGNTESIVSATDIYDTAAEKQGLYVLKNGNCDLASLSA